MDRLFAEDNIDHGNPVEPGEDLSHLGHFCLERDIDPDDEARGEEERCDNRGCEDEEDD